MKIMFPLCDYVANHVCVAKVSVGFDGVFQNLKHLSLNIYRNKGTSLWNFVWKSELRKYRHAKSIVEMCVIDL